MNTLKYKSNELDKYFKDMADYYMQQMKKGICPHCCDQHPLVIDNKEKFRFECSCGYMYEQISRSNI